MVRVLAIGPKVHGFKPSLGKGFLSVIKICNTPSFGEEERPETPGHKILQRVKITWKYEQRYIKC
jgi:hypothetical protein